VNHSSPDFALRSFLPRGRGFTLVELVVALSIGVIALGAAPFAVSRAYETMEYRATVKRVLAGVKLARLEAMRSGHSVAFNVDLDARRFGVEQRLDDELPERLKMRLVIADVEIDGARGGIRFYPDGSATGGTLEVLRPSGDGVRITVDWLIGRVSQQLVGA